MYVMIYQNSILRWYDSVPSDTVFDMWREMETYCKQDVRILMQGALRYFYSM